MHREVKHDGGREQRHLDPKRNARVAPLGLLHEQKEPRESHDNKADPSEWRERLRDFRDGLPPHADAEQAQIDNRDHAQQERKPEKMERLDPRDRPTRIANPRAQRGIVAPDEKADTARFRMLPSNHHVRDRPARGDDADPQRQ